MFLELPGRIGLLARVGTRAWYRALSSLDTTRGTRRVHIFVVALLLLLSIAPYYSLLIPSIGQRLANSPLFTFRVAHEMQELQILGVTAYASLVFRLRGGLIALAILATMPITQMVAPIVWGVPLQESVDIEQVLDVVLIVIMGLPFPLLFEALFRRFQAEREAEASRRADELKSEFLAIAAHELRTPLTTVVGLSELLTTGTVAAEDRERWLQRMRLDSVRLAKVVDALLNASLLRAGSVAVQWQRVEVLPAMQEAVHAVPSSDRHSVVVDCPPDIPSVAGDKGKVVQVLVNLLDNAVKYSPQGGQITLRARRGAKEVVISVSDQGIGIAPEDATQLFTTFRRIQREDTTTIPGMGLGLYIVKSLVELMRGRIWVESQVGKGSTFFFTLPVWEETSAPASLLYTAGKRARV